MLHYFGQTFELTFELEKSSLKAAAVVSTKAIVTVVKTPQTGLYDIETQVGRTYILTPN